MVLFFIDELYYYKVYEKVAEYDNDGDLDPWSLCLYMMITPVARVNIQKFLYIL